MTTSTAELITLRNGIAGLQVCPAVGGVITRYWYETPQPTKTIDWLWPASLTDLGKRNPLGMSCFPLVPFSSRVREGRFRFRDQRVQLPLNFLPQRHAIHGHGWQNPWQVNKATDDELIIEYGYQPATENWPWAYSSRQHFVLSEQMLTITIDVRNESDTIMPAGLGLHPYFIRTPQATVQARASQIWLNDDEVMPLECVPLHDPVVADQDINQGLIMAAISLDNTFTDWSREANIDWPEWQAGLKITASKGLDYLVVFSPAGEQFFCVEPVSNTTDAFNRAHQGEPVTATGITELAAGETLTGTVKFTPQLS